MPQAGFVGKGGCSPAVAQRRQNYRTPCQTINGLMENCLQ
jgi:hypothetical protein